jgi:hypothetical protein
MKQFNFEVKQRENGKETMYYGDSFVSYWSKGTCKYDRMVEACLYIEKVHNVRIKGDHILHFTEDNVVRLVDNREIQIVFSYSNN